MVRDHDIKAAFACWRGIPPSRWGRTTLSQTTLGLLRKYLCHYKLLVIGIYK